MANLVKDHFQRKARIRTRLAALACALWLLAIIGRLVHLQVFGHAKAQVRVLVQNQNNLDILPRRGAIIDRNGRILARSLSARSVYYAVNPADSASARWEPVRRAAAVLDLTASDLARIRSQLDRGAHFVWLKRKIEPEWAARVRNPRLGIDTLEESKRHYPLGPLAAQVLGGVNIDEVGLAGVEHKFNAVLLGQKGKALILRDAKRREYHYEILAAPENGRDIVLTLDQTIQYFAQSELEKAVAATGAAWGTVIISDPASGEILAMASAPAFDPNRFPTDPQATFDHAVRHTFEPGSTFKIVTAAAALERRAVRPAEAFDCSQGSIAAAGGPIRDHQTFGRLDFAGVIIHSSNVGTIQVGRRLGSAALREMTEAFGFGSKTGIELPGEEPGYFAPPERASSRSLASLSIGYEIAVTPIQLLQAVNAVANRGRLVPPRIVKSIQGNRPRNQRPSLPVILSPAACEKLVLILERVVLEGTGKAALLDGYEIAGKTGTAQKYDPAIKAYSNRRHTASFVGFVPADNPVLSMVVILDEPQTEEQYGGQVAAPVFREIARRVLRYLGVAPRRGPALLQASLQPEAGR